MLGVRLARRGMTSLDRAAHDRGCCRRDLASGQDRFDCIDQIAVFRDFASRAQSVLIVDRTPIAQPATTIDHERFAGPFREQLIGHAILEIFQDRESHPRSPRMLGDVLDRVTRVGIDGQEVDVPHFKSVSDDGQSRHVEFADRTARARKDDDDNLASMLRETVELTGSDVGKREVRDELPRFAIDQSSFTVEHHAETPPIPRPITTSQTRSPRRRKSNRFPNREPATAASPPGVSTGDESPQPPVRDE